MKDQPSGSTRGRRNHDQGFKDDLVAQSLAAGASVSAIAMKGGINANLLFKWRREHVKAIARSAPTAATLLPVCLVPDVAPTAQAKAIVVSGANRSARSGVIEVEIAGAQLRLRGDVDETMLGCVLRALRQSA